MTTSLTSDNHNLDIYYIKNLKEEFLTLLGSNIPVSADFALGSSSFILKKGYSVQEYQNFLLAIDIDYKLNYDLIKGNIVIKHNYSKNSLLDE
jgi:hypothetical protein